MSRSGYDEGCDGWASICWRGAVASASKGKRGQALFTEMAKALDAMPEKRLIAHELLTNTGEVCALGAVAKHRAIDVADLDPQNSEGVAATFDIAEALAREIVYENDEGGRYEETPEERWKRIRNWVDQNLKGASHGS